MTYLLRYQIMCYSINLLKINYEMNHLLEIFSGPILFCVFLKFIYIFLLLKMTIGFSLHTLRVTSARGGYTFLKDTYIDENDGWKGGLDNVSPFQLFLGSKLLYLWKHLPTFKRISHIFLVKILSCQIYVYIWQPPMVPSWEILFHKFASVW